MAKTKSKIAYTALIDVQWLLDQIEEARSNGSAAITGLLLVQQNLIGGLRIRTIPDKPTKTK